MVKRFLSAAGSMIRFSAFPMAGCEFGLAECKNRENKGFN